MAADRRQGRRNTWPLVSGVPVSVPMRNRSLILLLESHSSLQPPRHREHEITTLKL